MGGNAGVRMLAGRRADDQHLMRSATCVPVTTISPPPSWNVVRTGLIPVPFTGTSHKHPGDVTTPDCSVAESRSARSITPPSYCGRFVRTRVPWSETPVRRRSPLALRQEFFGVPWSHLVHRHCVVADSWAVCPSTIISHGDTRAALCFTLRDGVTCKGERWERGYGAEDLIHG